MKCLTLFLHASVEHEVVDSLRANERVSGFSLTPCQGHSTATHEDAFLADQDRVVGYVPRVRIEMTLGDQDVAEVLASLKDSSKKGTSIGVWQVTEVLEFGRL